VTIRDPQDTILLVAVLSLAALLAWRGTEYAEIVVTAAVAGVLTKVGTTGARPPDAPVAPNPQPHDDEENPGNGP